MLDNVGGGGARRSELLLTACLVEWCLVQHKALWNRHAVGRNISEQPKLAIHSPPDDRTKPGKTFPQVVFLPFRINYDLPYLHVKPLTYFVNSYPNI